MIHGMESRGRYNYRRRHYYEEDSFDYEYDYDPQYNVFDGFIGWPLGDYDWGN